MPMRFSAHALAAPALSLMLAAVLALAPAAPVSAHCQDGDAAAFRDGAGGDAAAPADLLEAAGRGEAESQYRLGFLYETGSGVPADPEAAADWYGKAAEQGHAGAQFHLGRLYEFGDCETQSYARAVEWYRPAAAQGHALALNALGYLYMNGQGVEQDPVRAFALFEIAAAREAEHAAANRDDLAGRMTPEQIAEAQRLAKDCAAKDYTGCGF